MTNRANPSHLDDPLDEFIRQMRIVFDNECYYACLSSCMILIDTCAALESDNGETEPAKFITWFDTNLKKYASPDGSSDYKNAISFSGTECYKFRCRLVHQSRSQSDLTEADPSVKSGRVAFRIGPGTFHMCNFEQTYFLDIKIFMEDIIQSVLAWRDSMSNNNNFQKHYQRMIRIGDKPPWKSRGGTYVY